MCGFSERKGPNYHEIAKLTNDLGWTRTAGDGQFYPRRDLTGLWIKKDGEYKEVDAMWWYLLKPGTDGKLTYNDEISCFNARNLESRLWKGAVKTSRAILPASAVGESLGSHHYYMQSNGGLLLACLYRTWVDADGSVKYSTAVITRPPHPRFSAYHSKSIPAFLPIDPSFVNEWLDCENDPSPAVMDALENPKIYTDLQVTRVKTFKRAEPMGGPELLKADA